MKIQITFLVHFFARKTKMRKHFDAKIRLLCSLRNSGTIYEIVQPAIDFGSEMKIKEAKHSTYNYFKSSQKI